MLYDYHRYWCPNIECCVTVAAIGVTSIKCYMTIIAICVTSIECCVTVVAIGVLV